MGGAATLGGTCWFGRKSAKVDHRPYTLSYRDMLYTKMTLSSSPIERCHCFLIGWVVLLQYHPEEGRWLLLFEYFDLSNYFD